MANTKLTQKAREWLRRYLPAEIIATCTAVLGAFVAYSLSDSLAVAAIAGTISENIGYYGYFIVRETTHHYARNHAHSGIRRIALTALKTARDLAVEFGPAEILDSFVFRPLFMFAGPQLLHHFALGILAGKLAADAIFYTFAIIGYEFKKRWN